jgi:Protein of unknown function (DUF3443)
MKLGTAILIGASAIVLAACHKSNNSSTATSAAGSNVIASAANNVAPASVTAGPASTANINTLYTAVKICAPGSTTNCQVIDNIAVDTGASGLRIIGTVLTPALAAALPIQVDGNNNAIYECAEFADGVAWGPTAIVDMTISGEVAASLPIQVITSALFPTPTPCSSAGTPLETVASFGANGTLGVSVFAQDCGSGCAESLTLNAGLYYACAAVAGCSVTTVPLTSVPGPEQVQNPVTLFPTDNAGVIIELPTVGATGAGSTTGALVFGIDSQTNNVSSTVSTVLTVDPIHGFVSTTLNNTAYPSSSFDTGSSAIYFDASSSEPTLTPCTDRPNAIFYCPSSTESFPAAVFSTSIVPIDITFSVADADTLLVAGGSLVAFSNLGGTAPDGVFDWGMPFFYGRNVYFAIEGKVTILADGPYVAF